MDDIKVPDELETLKARADIMGIKYRSNVTVDTLKELIEDKMTAKETPAKKTDAVDDEVARRKQVAKNAQEDAGKLIRVTVTCMNPAKKEWDGEILSVGNTYGNHKKYVPFNVAEGWHIPNIIYQYMKERKCQIFYDAKDSRGNKIRKGKLINEFAIEVLPDLTPDELEALATSQSARKAVD